MPSLKGTQTKVIFSLHLPAKAMHEIATLNFAAEAKAEGFVQISTIFEETADQEKEYAKRLFNFLKEDCVACNHSRAHFELLGENY